MHALKPRCVISQQYASRKRSNLEAGLGWDGKLRAGEDEGLLIVPWVHEGMDPPEVAVHTGGGQHELKLSLPGACNDFALGGRQAHEAWSPGSGSFLVLVWRSQSIEGPSEAQAAIAIGELTYGVYLPPSSFQTPPDPVSHHSDSFRKFRYNRWGL
ncbi:uncharacterized protein B0I36DRAFT_435383 [Microdochium trichocladiopsis]|uniref:Uncharacterized protein n=1 Tax=Microdochium trichocladiopsis TaxID=1682393 RepID=A0A9P9BP93_9PEZI|nr:uncharacterized protein B0I36DRAFT_435383 [Microdochium trichocladiopsis]KAH7021658.1 hypothetical protein B0I36DRAFT_435383 [Microdochium trichocladiopsis]